jgi:hypothetical protein
MLARMAIPDQNLCACGCGTPVAGKWKRGHSVRGEGGYRPPQPLPGPDDDFDIGDLEPDPEPERDWGATPQPADFDVPAWVSGEPGPEPEAEPPGHLKAAPSRGKQTGAKPRVRVTAATRKDVQAKIGIMLAIPGRIWAARDPLCGGTFLQQLPETTTALTDIVMDSADLVNFFTGPGGAFMKYLNLAAALQPVGVIVYAHHVAHSVALDDNGHPVQQAPDMAAYAA